MEVKLNLKLKEGSDIFDTVEVIQNILNMSELDAEPVFSFSEGDEKFKMYKMYKEWCRNLPTDLETIVNAMQLINLIEDGRFTFTQRSMDAEVYDYLNSTIYMVIDSPYSAGELFNSVRHNVFEFMKKYFKQK